MRSIRLLAATTVIVFGVAACGDDNGGGVEPGTDPVANFTAPACTVNVPCLFTDASSDDGTITGWNWAFGDGGTATIQNPSHTYTTAGSPTVTLTVTDDDGNTDTHSAVVSVTDGAPTNVPPTANFTVPSCVVNAPCLFTDTSTDPDGQVTGWSWTFGDGGTSLEQNPTHTFATEGTFNVELTATDNAGATDIITQAVTVAPPAATQCTASGATTVDCTLDITARSSLTVTLSSVSCELGGNKLTWGTVAPYSTTVFFNVCSQPAGAQRTLTDGSGAEAVFEAGTQVVLRFHRGTPDATDPPAGAPAGNLEGGHPSWTISFDDGGNTGGAGEPDFADAVVSVQATAR